MPPRSLGRLETLRRLAAQEDGLAVAQHRAQATAASLPERQPKIGHELAVHDGCPPRRQVTIFH